MVFGTINTLRILPRRWDTSLPTLHTDWNGGGGSKQKMIRPVFVYRSVLLELLQRRCRFKSCKVQTSSHSYSNIKRSIEWYTWTANHTLPTSESIRSSWATRSGIGRATRWSSTQ